MLQFVKITNRYSNFNFNFRYDMFLVSTLEMYKQKLSQNFTPFLTVLTDEHVGVTVNKRAAVEELSW